MTNKNIQMKKREGNEWDNLFPITLTENVFNETGVNIKDILIEQKNEIDTSLSDTIDYIANEQDELDDRISTSLQNTTDTLNNEFSIIKNDVSTKSKAINNNITSQFINMGNLQSFKDGIAKKHCRIAIVGDSITDGGNPVETSDRWVEQWQGIIRNEFPDVTFAINKFAIGGRTLQDFANPDFKSPTNFTATWATQNGVAWRKYVQDFTPDLIILAFGMNPNASDSPSYSMEVLKTFFGVYNKPSFLVLSSLVPNKTWANDWEKRAEYSREVKAYCSNNNMSFMDLYNKYRILVDGVDESQKIASGYRNGEGTTADGSGLKTTFSVLNGLFVQTLQLNESNKYKITIRGIVPITVSSTNLTIANTNIPLPNLTGSQNVTIVFHDKLIVYVGGVKYYDQDYYGSFKKEPITFGWEVGTGTTSGLSIINFDFVNAVGSYTQDDIFGKYVVGDISTKYPHGGNGVNHPSSFGYNLIFVPLLYDFIQQFKNEFNKDVLLTKTFTFDLSGAGTLDYYNVPNEEKIPFLVGILERSDGQLMKQRIDFNFINNDDVNRLENDEFLLRRTGGFIQIATKPQSVKTGFKFTTNLTN